MTAVCRICLVGNMTLHSVKNNLLISLYENMTNTKFNSEDARPRALCCYCYQKLLRCHTFAQMAVSSEKMFSYLYDNGLEVTHDYLSEVNFNMKQHLSMATMQFLAIDRHYAGSRVTIKDEPLACIDTTEDVTTEQDILVENHRKCLSIVEEDNNDNVQENDTEELLYNIPVGQTKPDDSETKFICNNCNQIFDMKIKIISHITNAHTQLQYSSSRKRSVTTSLNEDKILHNIKTRFTCQACDKKFNHKGDFTRHLRKHSGEKPFACNVCDKQFNRQFTLVSHMRTHSGVKPFACNVCGKQYYQKSGLVIHMRTHSGVKPFACNVCDKQFYQKTGLVKHTSTHSGVKPFTCNVCDKQYKRRTTLVSHMRTHSGVKPFACNECGKRFNNKCYLVSHMRTHTGEKPFACNECDKQFSWKTTLVSHIKRTHSIVESFACNVCHKQFRVKHHLVQHLEIHMREKPFARLPCTDTTEEVITKPDILVENRTKRLLTLEEGNNVNEHNMEALLYNDPVEQTKPDSSMTFICNNCYKIFDDKSKLISHIINAHSLSTQPKKQFACNLCDKKFNHKYLLVSHKRIHSGERPFACKECEKQFFYKYHLLRHLKIHMRHKPFTTRRLNSHQLAVKHAGTTSLKEEKILRNVKKQFPCHACDKKYDFKSSLARHLRSHTGEKPFACNACDKQFIVRSSLNIHMRTHTGEKPFACYVCRKQFTQKGQLVSHMITHSEQKPFACDGCDKKFNNKYGLIFHLRTHLKEKPFACKRCDKQYYRKTHLVRHMRTHSGEKPFACNECNSQFYQKPHLVEHMRSHAPQKHLKPAGPRGGKKTATLQLKLNN